MLNQHLLKNQKKWSHSKFTKQIEEFEVEYKTPQGIQKGYLSSNTNAPMPRREFKTNYKANESVSKHVKKMEEEFNKAVNEEAERCGTSDSFTRSLWFPSSIHTMPRILLVRKR